MSRPKLVVKLQPQLPGLTDLDVKRALNIWTWKDHFVKHVLESWDPSVTHDNSDNIESDGFMKPLGKHRIDIFRDIILCVL